MSNFEKKLELYIHDLVMFRDKKNGSISIETVLGMENIEDIYICHTNNFKFYESNLKILDERPKILTYWFAVYNDGYNDDIEIVGIWRFNDQTKNYEMVYYEQ